MDKITAADVEWLVGEVAAPGVVGYVEAVAAKAGISPRAALAMVLPYLAEAFFWP